MAEVEKTLAERESQYGTFADNSAVIQALKRVIHEAHGYTALKDDQRESLDLIATKMGRILGGNPDHIDTWHDISGYAVLVENRLIKEEEAKQ
jgi:hypothetical protein